MSAKHDLRHKIAAYVFGGDERNARMWEIAENLHRVDLTALERSEQVAEWVRLASEKQSSQSERKGHRPKGGVNEAVRSLGVDRASAHRAVKVASLAPEAKRAAIIMGLDDNHSALLDAAKAETPEARVEATRHSMNLRRGLWGTPTQNRQENPKL
ncbi:MAG: hypothetical protein AB7P12_08120 [Alphaproteobacteria bacterium]